MMICETCSHRIGGVCECGTKPVREGACPFHFPADHEGGRMVAETEDAGGG